MVINIEEGKVIKKIEIKGEKITLSGNKKIKIKKYGECLICCGNDKIIRLFGI